MKPPSDHHQEGPHRAQLCLGQMIREARKHRRCSQRCLAERSGLTAKMISQVELGHRNLSWQALTRVLAALDVELDWRPAEQPRGLATRLIRILRPMLPNLQELLAHFEQLENEKTKAGTLNKGTKALRAT